MTQDEIRKKLAFINKNEEALQIMRERAQEACNHPDVVEKRDGNTGNYDPSADCYWTDYTCPDCEKRWTVHH